MIQQAALVGDWANAAGARLHLSADHGAAVSNLDRAAPDTSCPPEAPDASWQFWVQEGSRGSYTGSDAATQGRSFVLEFRASRAGAVENCEVDVKVRHDDHGFSLCLVMDPDQTCTDGEFLRKAEPRSR